jgi:hypothetical protein
MAQNQEPILFINTDSNSFEPGVEITGVVLLRIFEDTNSDALWINIRGKETCALNELEATKETSVNTILNSTASLIKWSNCVAAKGDYSFPFRLQLPDNLPGSFAIRSDIRAKIHYRIKVKMMAGTKPCKATQPIAIRQSIDQQRFTTSHQSTEQVRMLCCINRGQIGIRMKLDKLSYSSTETAKLTVRLDSEAMRQPIYSLQCKLLREASFFMNGEEVKSTSEEIFNINLDKLPNQESLLGDSGLDVLIPLGEYQQLIQSTSTTYGSLVRCNFLLLVKCMLGVWFAAPYLSAPIIIYNEDTPSVQQWDQPEHWEPYGTSELVVPLYVIESISKD